MQPLDQWLAEQPPLDFPRAGATQYPQRLLNVANYLNQNVHPHVEKGALLQKEGFLTDHGPEHIATVIRRETDMVMRAVGNQPALTAYETYLLLMATHFHDVGNLYGRSGHERRMHEIMRNLGPLVGDDMAELRAIQRIAAAHGGTIAGNKDTISTLPLTDPVLGQQVRWQTLAAILRFADELADDSGRAARFLIELGVIPSKSEIYQRYAAGLHSVLINPRDRVVSLHFDMTRDVALSKLGKGRKRVFLLDEIYSRTLKTYAEAVYCTRFMHEVVRIDAINVRIEVFNDAHSMQPLVEPIGYRLEQSGYPLVEDDITHMCPDLRWNGKKLQAHLQ